MSEQFTELSFGI